MKLLSSILILAGFFLLIANGFLYWKRNNPNRLQFEGAIVSSQDKSSVFSTPTGIVIEDIAIRLPIIPAKNLEGKWETTPDGVSYLTTSPAPGQKGNSILYGHNWGSILGPLYQITPGNKIDIYFSDGTKIKFEVEYVQEVTPQDVSILAPTNDRRITLYTCSGFLDQKRLVVTALVVDSYSLKSF